MNNIIIKARELLIKQDITSFELSITDMKFDKNIIFDTFENYAKLTGITAASLRKIKDGCTLVKNPGVKNPGVKNPESRDPIYVILTHEKPAATLYRAGNSNRRDFNDGRINFTLAHEIGHIHLEHTQDCASEEKQANTFASELLMPDLVLLELRRELESIGKKLDAAKISRLFGVSLAAAETKISQMSRKNFFSAELKSELMEKYRPLIVNYIDRFSGMIQKTLNEKSEKGEKLCGIM